MIIIIISIITIRIGQSYLIILHWFTISQTVLLRKWTVLWNHLQLLWHLRVVLGSVWMQYLLYLAQGAWESAARIHHITTVTLPETNSKRQWKRMVARRLFPFGFRPISRAKWLVLGANFMIQLLPLTRYSPSKVSNIRQRLLYHTAAILVASHHTKNTRVKTWPQPMDHGSPEKREKKKTALSFLSCTSWARSLWRGGFFTERIGFHDLGNLENGEQKPMDGTLLRSMLDDGLWFVLRSW